MNAIFIMKDLENISEAEKSKYIQKAENLAKEIRNRDVLLIQDKNRI